MSDPLKFGFVTCVQLGLDVMEEIYALGGKLSLAVTLPDDKASAKSGRVYIDAFCAERRIPLVKSPSVNDPSVVNAVFEHQLDWLFIIGWSQIAREPILNAPRLGCIGMHPSLLPEGRGRASIPWAILRGLTETGVTMFVLDQGVDTGPLLAATKILISPEMNSTRLYEDVQLAHRTLIREQWTSLSHGRVRAVPQDLEAGSTWPGRTPADGQIHSGMDADMALRLIRATTRPYPGAFWQAGDETIRAWAARRTSAAGTLPWFRCSNGLIEATEFDRERKRDAR